MDLKKKNDRPATRRLLTTREAAEYLGLAEWTLRAWTNQRRIPNVKISGAVRSKISDVDAFIAASRRPARGRGDD